MIHFPVICKLVGGGIHWRHLFPCKRDSGSSARAATDPPCTHPPAAPNTRLPGVPAEDDPHPTTHAEFPPIEFERITAVLPKGKKFVRTRAGSGSAPAWISAACRWDAHRQGRAPSGCLSTKSPRRQVRKVIFKSVYLAAPPPLSKQT